VNRQIAAAALHCYSKVRDLISGKGEPMVTILIVLVVLMLLGAIPAWPHSRSWGYGPSGGLGLILLIVVILLLAGRI
jgi:hypothetical protein